MKAFLPLCLETETTQAAAPCVGVISPSGRLMENPIAGLDYIIIGMSGQRVTPIRQRSTPLLCST